MIPGVPGALLQAPLSIISSFIRTLILCEKIFKITSRARYLKFCENVHHPMCVTFHVSCVMCHVSCLCVMCHISGVRCYVSGVRCQVSGVRYQVSGVRCQVSGIRCQVSGVQNGWMLTSSEVSMENKRGYPVYHRIHRCVHIP